MLVLNAAQMQRFLIIGLLMYDDRYTVSDSIARSLITPNN